MKKNRIASTRTLLPIIMAATMIFTLGCEEEDIYIPGANQCPPVGPEDSKTVTFIAQPTGTLISAFNGAVELNFPSGTVHFPTEFTLISVNMYNVNSNGKNVMNQGFRLEMEDGAADLILNEHVEVHLRYDLAKKSWSQNKAPDETKLAIFNAYPNIEACQRMNSTGDCCTDQDCKMVMGCIDQFGYYVVGEN